jgi:FkbM family methyltransferase
MLDSILVGVPAVVRRGPVGRSNHGASLLQMVGLQELSCDSESDYVAKAIALANSPPDRERIRKHLQTLRQAEIPVYYDTALFSQRVGAAFERLHGQYQRRYSRLRADATGLRQSVMQTARRLIGERMELNALTDIGIVRLLIVPYFQTTRTEPRYMLDIGGCHGAMSEPLLARGWRADVFEPDPAAREVLQQNLAKYTGRVRIHALVAGSQSAGSVAFHQATVQGLSGLNDSPFAATANVLQVPSTTLADFCAQQSITSIDFLKIDAEGFDFDVLESLDFQRVQPELILVEYGTHFQRQPLSVVNQAICDMASRGYGAIVFAYADDGNFKRSVWQYRLTGLLVDEPLPAETGESFGNVLFYRAENPRVLLNLQALLDSCDDPRKLWS